MRRTLVTSAILFVGCVVGLRADAPKTTRLWVDLLARKVFVNDASAGEPLGDAYYRVVHSDETTEILVKHVNPLLFKHTFEVTTAPSESALAVETFAKAFSELLARFANKAAGLPSPVIDGLNFEKFRTQINAMFANVDSIKGWIDFSLDPAMHAELRDAVKGLPAAVDETNASYARALQLHLKCMRGEMLATDAGPLPCSAPLNFGAVLHERNAAAAYGLLRARLDELRAAEASVTTAQAAVDAARIKVDADRKALNAAPKNTRLQDALKASEGTLKTAETGLATAKGSAAYIAYENQKKAADQARSEWDASRVELARVEADATATQTTIGNFLRDAVSIQTQVEKAGTLLKGFAADAAAVGGDKPAKSIPYALETTTVVIKVEKENKYANYLSDAAKREQAKGADGKVIVKPYRVASVRPGVAFVLGLLRNPEFATTKSGDKFKITEKSTELTRFNVAAMIHVVPRGWDEPTFGGFFQFGVSPKNNETAFFVGAGLQLESMLTFGAGAMIQQVRRLDSGQNVGDLLASPDDLKVSTPFKAALYVHATIELSKKK